MLYWSHLHNAIQRPYNNLKEKITKLIFNPILKNISICFSCGSQETRPRNNPQQLKTIQHRMHHKNSFLRSKIKRSCTLRNTLPQHKIRLIIVSRQQQQRFRIWWPFVAGNFDHGLYQAYLKKPKKCYVKGRFRQFGCLAEQTIPSIKIEDVEIHRWD